MVYPWTCVCFYVLLISKLVIIIISFWPVSKFFSFLYICMSTHPIDDIRGWNAIVPTNHEISNHLIVQIIFGNPINVHNIFQSIYEVGLCEAVMLVCIAILVNVAISNR